MQSAGNVQTGHSGAVARIVLLGVGMGTLCGAPVRCSSQRSGRRKRQTTPPARNPQVPSVWDVAFETWPADQPVFQHPSFIAYRNATAFPHARTLNALSIQDFNGLPPFLREQNVMVFRLGAGRFALIRLPDKTALRDLFLFDTEIFGAEVVDVTPLNEELLSVYSLVNRHSETNLINLALASGCLSDALELDKRHSFPPAATAQSTFTFSFRPSSRVPSVTLEHKAGQVEVDAIFIARLGGQRTLFVVEGKNELAFSTKGSLSKTKLRYAAEAVASAGPLDLPIVPVYLRASRHGDVAEFRVARCQRFDPRQALNEIVVEHAAAVRVRVPTS